MTKLFKIALLGNERHLLHALRAMLQFHIFASNQEYPYIFYLFGNFPKEILEGQAFNFQYIGDNREDFDAFGEEYDVILDPEKDFKSGSDFALSQWFQVKLNIKPSSKSAPFIASWSNYSIRGTSFRLNASTIPVGNTVFVLPPSPQDREWPSLPKFAGRWWTEAIELLDQAKYSLVYPQIQFEKYDYRFFFTGEETICNRCYMPLCNNLQDLMYHLLSARMYFGCDNLIADLAAAVHIPSIILHAKERVINREIFSTRNDEYILRHLYLGQSHRWTHEKIRQAIDYVETRFIPFSRSIGGFDRVRSVLSTGGDEAAEAE